MSAAVTFVLYEFDEPCLLPDSLDIQGFRTHLHQSWQNRRWQYHYPESDELQPEATATTPPFLQWDGQQVTARNYTGIIYYQGVTIYILPKLFKELWAGQPPATQIQTAFAHLHWYLSYCQQVVFPFQWEWIEASTGDILQGWIRFFATYTTRLLAEQPYQAYHAYVDETAYVRGKLSVSHYLSQQVARGQWQRLQTEQQPFTLDNPFNQIVRYTLRQLLILANTDNRLLLQECLHLLADISDRVCTPADCEQVHVNRSYPNHQQVLDMCRFFLAAETAALEGNFQQAFTFLVPMERVFEDFVAGFIDKHFPAWNMERQPARRFAQSAQATSVWIRPDIWLPGHRRILDTKYKIQSLITLTPKVASEDVYQMLAYALGYRISHTHLLYPDVSEKEVITYVIPGPVSEIYVHLHRLPVVQLVSSHSWEELVDRLRKCIENIVSS